MTVDHVANSLARLPEQIKDKPYFQAVVTAFANQFQDLETAGQDLLLLCGVSRATGATLTSIGDLVGQPRNGVEDDDTYRRYIRARIFANRSNGTVRDFVRVSRLVLNQSDDCQVIRQSDSVVVVRVFSDAYVVNEELAELMLSFLRSVVSAGGRVILESANDAANHLFQLDGAIGLDVGTFADARE